MCGSMVLGGTVRTDTFVLLNFYFFYFFILVVMDGDLYFVNCRYDFIFGAMFVGAVKLICETLPP